MRVVSRPPLSAFVISPEQRGTKEVRVIFHPPSRRFRVTADAKALILRHRHANRRWQPICMFLIEVPVARADCEVDHAVVKQVLSYFVRNQQAADTIEGVARWRLLQEQIHRSVRETEVAMDWLVKKGFLEQTLPGGSRNPIFRLNQKQLELAKSFLREQDGEGQLKPRRKTLK